MRDVVAIILGGGRGTRLFPLTLERAKPAVGFAGKYRLIDIPISNCINSDIRRVFILTQFLSTSLHRHIMQTYQFGWFTEGFIDILAAEQTPRARIGSKVQRMPSGQLSNTQPTISQTRC